MTPESQREAIARACGWKSTIESWYSPEGSAYARSVFRRKADELIDDSHILPDYLNDLNAMHEAEKKLDPAHPYKAPWLFYRTAILDLAGDQNQHATASQKAEAFLRALNLLTDS